jgi:hypothetical protein
MVFESPGLGMARPVYGKPVARVRGSSSVRPPQSLQHFSPRKNWGTTNAVEIRPARTIIFSLLFRIGPDQRKLTKRKLEQNKFFFFFREFEFSLKWRMLERREGLDFYWARARIGHTGGGNHHW